MKYRVLLLLALSLSSLGYSQSSPYSSVPAYPETYTAGSVAARTIDGLIFRFHWATEGLRENDLAYKPGQGARTTQETIEHIYEMSFIVANAASNKSNVKGQDVKLPFAEMRKKTLENLREASNKLLSIPDQEMKNLKVIFTDGKKNHEYPFWNVINGPLEDCIWHTGQIVSFRRSSGNPIADKDYFMGK
ncbi:hypothetical protein BH10BAC4_BH10BAC4_23350 [soil metagenome]